MTLNQSWMLVVISLTSWTALSLWVDRRGERQINRWFASILAALGLPQVYFYSLTLEPGGWPAFGHLAQALLWAKGPLMLVFVSLAVGRPVRTPALHFTPFLAVALSIHFLDEQTNHRLSLLGALHALTYLGLALRLLTRHRQRLAQIYKGFKNSAYFWLLFVIVAMAVMLGIDFFLVAGYLLEKLYWLDVARILTWCMSLYLITVALFSLYRPELFFSIGGDGGPDISPEQAFGAAANVQPAEAPAPDQAKDEPKAVARVGRELDQSSAALLARKLEALMSQEQLYLQNELSLPGLAEALGITVHQASELLNVHLETSFYDYLNRLRLAYACRLLDDPDCSLRIVDLAFAAGFNNKNSFYRAFRATLGTTPAEYRARKQAVGSLPAQP